MTRLLSWMMVAALLLTLVWPVTAWAQPEGESSGAKSTSLQEETPKQVKEKVSKRLEAQFEDKEQVTFLVKLKEQADTKKAVKQATAMAKKEKASPAKTELMQRSAVVSALRSTSLDTQYELKEWLGKQKKEGKVSKIKSFYIVNALAITGTKEVMEQIAVFAEVDKVLPNEVRQLHPTKRVKEKKAQKKSVVEKTGSKTNDANTASIEWNIDQVLAPQVWEMGIDGAGTVVANIDTGVEWDHPGLKNQYRGYDADSDSVDHNMNWFDAVGGEPTPYDDLAHGTHTMGTMVGVEENGSNQVGVAPGAKWIAVKAFSESGGTDIDLLEAGEWILAPTDAAGNPHPEKAPDVVNNSWGGGPGLDEWYRPMVQNWRAANIFPEFSAGNTGISNPGGPGSVATPSNYPESFATGATDINNRLANFSLLGPSPYDEIKPDISAPGVNIRSTVPGGGYEGGWNGTSMAGPHVSAVVALLKQADSSLTVDEIEQILMETAIPLTDSTYPESPNNGYGEGLVNAYDAVSTVMTGLGSVEGQVLKEGEDTEAPTYQVGAPEPGYAGMPLYLGASVQDNVSIKEVVLHYSDDGQSWETYEAERTSGNYRDGLYQAQVPGEKVTGDFSRYKFKITDFGGNEVMTEEFEMEVLAPVTIGYEQDFESDATGWYSYGTNDSWQRGTPTSGPGEAFDGESVYATNLAGHYADSANMTLVMPPAAIPAEGETYLQYGEWFNLESFFDYGHVVISTDGSSWEQVVEKNGETSGWQDAEVDLTAYAGQTILIGFHVETDGSVTKDGWYIDEVRLSDEPFTAPTVNKENVKESATTKDKKGKVDPSTLLPEERQWYASNDQSETKGNNTPSALPLEATVSVLESGRTVNTNPADGNYNLMHAVGEYTLLAEAYGFRSQEQTVQIAEDEATVANFVLDPVPQGTITGTITNEATGEPIAGATVFLVEDAAIEPVVTDTDGSFSMEAYEGSYTLKVTASGYHSKEREVVVSGGETTEVEMALKPFIGYTGEIGYDDGTAENAHAMFDAGNGWAVKMSLEEGEERALVQSGLFRFWGTDWPSPGGDEFQVEVYDASGPDGAPGKKLAGPIDATAIRNGEDWTEVDLSGEGIMVEGDFYMVYMQSRAHPDIPGLAADEDGELANRSWSYIGGAWQQTPEEDGNYMIRARVQYEVSAPVITSPADGSYTKHDEITVEGNTSPGVKVHLYNHGEEVATTTATDTGAFAAEVDLSTGENKLSAKSSTDAGMTEPSPEVTIIVDKKRPALTIEAPSDGEKTNKEVVTVRGNASDNEGLQWLKINNKKVTVQEDGSFSKRILLDEGENTIKVVARDKAGNKKQKRIKVYAKFSEPVIENLQPAEDKHLSAGQTLIVQFESEPGLKADFVIQAPLINPMLTKRAPGVMMMPDLPTSFPIMETSPGHYVGYWTATSNLIAAGARVEVSAEDAFGNETEALADGKLYINTEQK
ncbi:S8 family serine peptidase [Mechercharimyces sp. CAU 1602]|uniref:S8 family serine peptidase n=1 Tax=Mechercharimyces sp. CAU 1602 TaxID=2973933 RepID=UPI00216166F7|nr:S8 family serine peptidase [Mechercharimyces sp. CAU 1602]MCS1350640.1 S8 family serine peptidase [Mechercharimyces sp. CAU 1602]